MTWPTTKHSEWAPETKSNYLPACPPTRPSACLLIRPESGPRTCERASERVWIGLQREALLLASYVTHWLHSMANTCIGSMHDVVDKVWVPCVTLILTSIKNTETKKASQLDTIEQMSPTGLLVQPRSSTVYSVIVKPGSVNSFMCKAHCFLVNQSCHHQL